MRKVNPLTLWRHTRMRLEFARAGDAAGRKVASFENAIAGMRQRRQTSPRVR